MELQTSYMGIALKNPIIVGACNLSTDLSMAKKLEEAGAAAIVFKSLFEEQLYLEACELDDDLHQYDNLNAEMGSIFPQIEHSGPKAHLLALKNLKQSVSIPVFGSLNCLDNNSWAEFAIYMAETGIDGLELNFYNTIIDSDRTPEAIEHERLEALKRVKSAVKIPVAVKLSSFYTNPLHIIKKMDSAGANGFVLFNKLFQPDIDIHTKKMKQPFNLSSKGENRLSLRYAGLLFGNIKGDVCSNTGIIDAEDMVSNILAGASAVQVVSTIYKNGPTQITKMINELTAYMTKNSYKSIDEMRGILSRKNSEDPYAYTRAQYVDFLMHANKQSKNLAI